MNGKFFLFNINGEIKNFEVENNESLVNLLKRKKYRGLRQACDGGNCGGCTVLINKKPHLSCMMHALQAVDKEILTIDGIINYNEELNLLPICFKKAGSAQCGFCTCGFIMATAGLYFENSNPDKNEIIKSLSGNLCRCTGYEKIIKGAEFFFDVINKRKKIKEESFDYNPLGKPVDKIDGDGLTTGRALYTSDMNFPEQLYMKLCLSTKAHAIIEEIDLTEAEKIKGIKLILTYKNTPDIYYTSAAQGYPEPSPYDCLMFNKRIRFYGEPVAAVIADSLETAELAAKKIKVIYSDLPVMLNFEDSYYNTKSEIHPEGNNITNISDKTKNLVAEFDFSCGTIIKSDDIVSVEGIFETSKQQHVHLEPQVAIAYKDEYGRLNIYSSTQVPFDVRRIVASVMKLPFSKVRVIKPRIGGGFGGKQEILIENLVSYAALQLNKPVKLLLTRNEVFSFARTRHPFRTKLKLGFNRNGKLVNLETEILTDTGAYGGHASTVAELAAMRIMSLYNSENINVNIKAIYTNKAPAGAFRGYGEPQIMFPLESLIDEAAVKLNFKPYELRRKNHVKKGDFLKVETFFVKPYPKGEKINTCELPELISCGLKYIDFENKRISKDRDIVTGKGMAITMQGSGIANITRSSVTVSLNEDGSIQLMSGAVDVGTGADTVLTQIAAETLKIPIKNIHLIVADTAVTPYDSGSYASNTTYFAGHAVYKVCEKLKVKILEWVSKKYNLQINELELKENYVQGSVFKKSLKTIANEIFSDLKVADTVFNVTVKKNTSSPPFAATFVDIDVNKKTGKIKVQKVVQMLDCGKIINPRLAEGQIEGTTLQAIGYALYEEINYTATGKNIENDLFTYKIPTIFEKPEYKIEFIESGEPTGPYGAKAVGEVAYASVAPAINNALYDALKIHVRSLPITPEKILNNLNQK